MLSLPTREEYARKVQSMGHAEMDSDFVYSCYCKFLRVVDMMHDRFPEMSYASLAKEYIEWLKTHR